jgi:hypothetical protein
MHRCVGIRYAVCGVEPYACTTCPLPCRPRARRPRENQYGPVNPFRAKSLMHHARLAASTARSAPSRLRRVPNAGAAACSACPVLAKFGRGLPELRTPKFLRVPASSRSSQAEPHGTRRRWSTFTLRVAGQPANRPTGDNGRARRWRSLHPS